VKTVVLGCLKNKKYFLKDIESKGLKTLGANYNGLGALNVGSVLMGFSDF
jgi:hypothetical protein